MAQTEETKRNHTPASDLDDDIFTILNSSRPTYPGGGPNREQPPATRLVQSNPTPAQPAAQPVAPTPVQPEPIPEPAPQPVSEPQPIPQPVAQPEPEETEPWRPVIQPNVTPQPQPKPQQPKPQVQPQPQPQPQAQEPPQKRPVISHAMPGQEEEVPTEVWPDINTLEEIPDPEPVRRLFPTGKKKWIFVCAVYLLILLVGFSARFIISATRKSDTETDSISVSDSATVGTTESASEADDKETKTTEAEEESSQDDNSVEIVSLSLENTYLALLEENTATVKVSISAHGAASSSDLVWTSSDDTIATVDQSGVVTGVSAGSCTITVAAKDNPEISADLDLAVRHLEERDGCTYVDGILIVNKTYSLPEDYDPNGLTAETQAALAEMISAASQEGLNLYDASDYRSYADQVVIYEQYCTRDGWEEADTYSARPGHSEHQTGMTIDFNSIDDSFGDTAEAAWLAEHCAEYGFIIRFPADKVDETGYKYESWHVRYLGVETATEIQKLGVCLEEYLGVDSAYQTTWPEDPCNPEAAQ
jgi:LAS superfamily LD-carboxypeptidase LdcB